MKVSYNQIVCYSNKNNRLWKTKLFKNTLISKLILILKMPKQMITSISQMIIFINHNQIIAYNWNSSCKNLNHSKYLCKSSLYLLGNCCRHFQISTWLATISEYIIWMQTITNKKILHSMEMDNRLASCTVYKTNYVSILRTSCRISYG